MEKSRGYMDSRLAKRIIDQMTEYGSTSLVPFFRGESLLHPELFDILAYAIDKNVDDIQFTTNASLLSPGNTEKLLDIGLKFVSFSLDTVNSALYNKNRRGADFDTTKKNILHFIKRRNELGVPTMIQVSAVETNEHLPGMEEFVAYWQNKVERVRVYVEHSTNGKPGKVIEKLPEFKHRMPCLKLYSDLVVYWNGEIALCNHDWTRIVTRKRIGNASDQDISAIWNSPAYKAIRKAHERGAYAGLDPCENCDHWKMYYMRSGYIGRTYSSDDAGKCEV
jgi:radical SAM protein with 4Fe4S-binding SPASM domain